MGEGSGPGVGSCRSESARARSIDLRSMSAMSRRPRPEVKTPGCVSPPWRQCWRTRPGAVNATARAFAFGCAAVRRVRRGVPPEGMPPEGVARKGNGATLERGNRLAIPHRLRRVPHPVHGDRAPLLVRDLLHRPRGRARLVADPPLERRRSCRAGHGHARDLRGTPQRPLRSDPGPCRGRIALRRGLRPHLGGGRALASLRALRPVHRRRDEHPRRGDPLDHRALVRAPARDDDRDREGRHRDRSDGAAAVGGDPDCRTRLARRGPCSGGHGGGRAGRRGGVDEAPAPRPPGRPDVRPGWRRRASPRSVGAACSGPSARPSSSSFRP